MSTARRSVLPLPNWSNRPPPWEADGISWRKRRVGAILLDLRGSASEDCTPSAMLRLVRHSSPPATEHSADRSPAFAWERGPRLPSGLGRIYWLIHVRTQRAVHPHSG